MEPRTIRGGTIEELKAKKYTIGVGISLGNKWFTPENIFESIKWTLQYSKKEVVVYMADSIHAINITVRGRKSVKVAERMACEAGDELLGKIKEKVKTLSIEEQDRIVFVRWNDIVDDKFRSKVEFLKAKYAEPGPFQDTIHDIVRNHVSSENRDFSDKDIHRFGEYVIEEMPECINRVPMKGIIVDAYIYPQDNKLVEFFERIQKGDIFPEIRSHIFDTEPKVFIELR